MPFSPSLSHLESPFPSIVVLLGLATFAERDSIQFYPFCLRQRLFLEKRKGVTVQHLLFFVHSSADGRPGWSHFLATVTRAAVTMTLQLSLQWEVDSRCRHMKAVAGWLVFQGTPRLFSGVAVRVFTPSRREQSILWPILTSICSYLLS